MKKKILVIEDDEDIRESMRDLLEDDGNEVVCANNGFDGINYLRAEAQLPHLILLDLMMPEMDGYEFRTAQEKDPRLASLPVVLMTADGHVESKKARIGAKDFLKKPIDIKSLIRVVEQNCL